MFDIYIYVLYYIYTSFSVYNNPIKAIDKGTPTALEAHWRGPLGGFPKVFLEPQYIGTQQLEQFRSSILPAGKGGAGGEESMTGLK